MHEIALTSRAFLFEVNVKARLVRPTNTNIKKGKPFKPLIDNKQGRGDRGSRDAIKVNADGSVDLFFGPKPPKSGEDNWVQTISGRPWFLYFRFYGPLEAYFDKSWKMDDIVKSK